MQLGTKGISSAHQKANNSKHVQAYPGHKGQLCVKNEHSQAEHGFYNAFLCWLLFGHLDFARTNNSCLLFFQAFVITLVFQVFVFGGDSLKAKHAFPLLLVLHLIQLRLVNIPQSIGSTLSGFVVLRKVKEFLKAEEISQTEKTEPNMNFSECPRVEFTLSVACVFQARVKFTETKPLFSSFAAEAVHFENATFHWPGNLLTLER